MRFINKITDAAKQSFTLVGEAGEQINFNLFFAPRQNAWFCDLSWGDFTANGIRLGLSPNILRTFRNKITFGLAVISSDGYDPKAINDFLSGRVQLYLLNAADVAQVEGALFS